jgi:ABC-2 type transport system permease protein
VTSVLLNPTSNPQATLPGSLGQAQQAQQQIPTLLAFDQSILLVWPQVVVLVAMTVACFALAYVAFMRQEVRA